MLVSLISTLEMLCSHFLCNAFFYKESLLWLLIPGMLAQVAFHCTLLLTMGFNIRKNSICWSQLSAETVSYQPDLYS